MPSTSSTATVPRDCRAIARSAATLALGLALAGCMVMPKPATQDEVRDRVKGDTGKMYADQVPITKPVTLEEAIARALKYNLDYRLKKMESALALGLTEYSNYDMLPSLLTTAGYRTRNNYSGGAAIGIDDGIQSLRPSSSEDKTHRIAGAEFSWNMLDFGVSYFRARQQADQYLISEERRRKVVQSMVQDVRSAYWRALGAQRMATQANGILDRANIALGRSREAESQRVLPAGIALNYQRALLDATSLLNTRRQDLEFAKRELGALMNVEPGVDFTIAEAEESPLPAPPVDVSKLEEMALLQRPELREEDFKKRITADETRRQLLSLLPAITFDAGREWDSNHLLANNTWSQGGIRVSWNLIRLASLPSMMKTQEAQEQNDQARRMALSMAVLTQVRVGADRYRFAVEDYRLADQAAQVDRRLSDYTRATVTARLDSELEAIRTQARSVLGAYQRAYAYANAQIAFGKLYNTLGFDPLPDDFDQDDLAHLTDRVRTHLRATETETLKMSSQLFGFLPTVSIRVVGVADPVTQVRMRADVSALLERNLVNVDAEHGLPLTLSLQREPKGGIEMATWTMELDDGKGHALGEATHSSSMPNDARNTAYEASLVAALTSRLPQVRTWLASTIESDKPPSAIETPPVSASPAPVTEAAK